MIGQLRGILLEKLPPVLLLDVQGVGYEVDAPLSTFYRLPDCGQEIILHTHLVIREDAHQIYGFFTREERSLFRTLLKVNGVGPKLGLTILSSIEPNEFVRCVMQHDADSLTALPGVGKKTAERLIIEMKDKVSSWLPTTLPEANPASHALSTARGRQQVIQDAVSALIALGYKPPEASRAVAKADDGALDSEAIIRQALREMMT